LSHNPVRIALHGWLALAQDLRAARGVRARLRVLLGPPAVSHTASETPT
jgi:hypothetical protein